VRHLFAAFDLRADKLYGHVKPRKRRGEFLAFLRYVRSLHPLETRIAIVLDNFSPHLTTKLDQRVGEFATASNIELAYVPTNASWLTGSSRSSRGFATSPSAACETLARRGRAVPRRAPARTRRVSLCASGTVVSSGFRAGRLGPPSE